MGRLNKVGDTINSFLLGAGFTFLFLTINQNLVAKIHADVNVITPIQHTTVETLTVFALSTLLGSTIYLLTNLKTK